MVIIVRARKFDCLMSVFFEEYFKNFHDIFHTDTILRSFSFCDWDIYIEDDNSRLKTKIH